MVFLGLSFEEPLSDVKIYIGLWFQIPKYLNLLYAYLVNKLDVSGSIIINVVGREVYSVFNLLHIQQIKNSQLTLRRHQVPDSWKGRIPEGLPLQHGHHWFSNGSKKIWTGMKSYFCNRLERCSYNLPSCPCIFWALGDVLYSFF